MSRLRSWWSALPGAGIVAGIVLSTLLRVRMLFTPITSDEGGYLAIARAWAHGAVLYRDVWVDRPQGLIVVFRIWDGITGGSTAWMRGLAMVFAAGLVLAVAVATTRVAGKLAGGVAAVLVGVVASSPVIEGHLLNGELMSGAFAAGGLAVGFTAIVSGNRPRLWVLSGVLAGCALSIKQSGYDGLLTLLAWLALAVPFGWRSARQVLAAAWRLLAGTAAVLTVLVLHGALTGFGRWWYGVVGYRLEARSALSGGNWERLRATGELAFPLLAPLVAVCLFGAVMAAPRGMRLRRGGSGYGWLLVLWPVMSITAFAVGGQFHRHYWVTLCPALSAVAAAAMCRAVRRPALVWVLAAVALVPGARDAVDVLRVDRDHISRVASGDGRSLIDEGVAQWFDDTRRPGDTMIVLCASAGFYANADLDPPYPYLWWDNVMQARGALPELLTFLSDDSAQPRFVAIYQRPDRCDPSGELGAVVAHHYLPYAVVDGVRVLQRRPEALLNRRVLQLY